MDIYTIIAGEYSLCELTFQSASNILYSLSGWNLKRTFCDEKSHENAAKELCNTFQNMLLLEKKRQQRMFLDKEVLGKQD